LPSFGEKLKLEREKRKITLEQISSITKIGTRMLQALEEQKFSQLPGGIFNKGFVRAYARVVGLDEDQAVADYLEASGDAAPPKPETVTREGSSRAEEESRLSRLDAISDSPSRPLPWGAFAVVLLLVALALSIWSHRRREQEKLAHPANTGQIQPSPGASLIQSGESSSPASAGAAGAPGAVSASTGSSVNPDGSSSQTGASAANSSGSNAGTVPSENSSAAKDATTPATGEFQLVIKAREQSRIWLVVDGKFTGSETLEAGSNRTISAQKNVVVKTGNAGALDFQLNGKKLEVGGNAGEVKTITIGRAGVIASPASPAPNAP
jgi:cytoskeletal protein RodZ